MSDIEIGPGNLVVDPVVLDGIGDSLSVAGVLDTADLDPAVLVQADFTGIDVQAPEGAVRADGTAIRVEGRLSSIENEGTIDGGFNGIDIANGTDASAIVENEGLITSESRAINIGGFGARLENHGLIETTDDPRNGTVYGDITTSSIVIENGRDGIIDVGEGNNGDAISLELGPEVSGSIVNEGLIQGRGEALGNNQASAVRLYSGIDRPDDRPSVFTGDVINEEDGILSAETGPAVIVEADTTLDGDLINRGLIESPDEATGNGVLFEAGSFLTGRLINEDGGVIDGGRDGINIGNGGPGSFVIENEGTVTSTSRAVNLGADSNTLINDGLLVTSDDPRNGTVYGDILADEIVIENGRDGIIDVGEGNNGDAISLELGPEVSGSIVNEGLIQGRGDALGNNQASAVRLYSGIDQPDDQPSVFTGDIVNQRSGILSAETGPAVIVEDDTTLEGRIVNRGEIAGGVDEGGLTAGGEPGSGRLAVDTREAEGPVQLINTGSILGDIVLSEQDDVYVGLRGEVDGIVSGGGGSDLLAGGREDDVLHGDDGADTLSGGRGDDLLEGGGDADLLFGGRGDDTLRGGEGDDRLFGGRGDDIVDGGAGNDLLSGGRGEDIFVLAPGGGTDTILDFEVGEDLIGLAGLGFADADDALDNSFDVGGGTRIDYGTGDSVLLAGVELSDLSGDALLV